MTSRIEIRPKLLDASRLLLLGCALLAWPQPKPSVRIVSPTKNAVVRPGRRLAVEVSAMGRFTAVAVSAGGPLSESFMGGDLIEPKPNHGPAYALSIMIPTKADPGLYYLTATGTTASGMVVESDSVTIDVEPARIPPVSIDPPTITLPVGSYRTLSVSGKYADGTEVSLNGSTRITFVSETPAIASVDRDGKVVGRSAGTTKITVFGTYTVEVTVLDQKR